jgi:hypothetical protein
MWGRGVSESGRVRGGRKRQVSSKWEEKGGVDTIERECCCVHDDLHQLP